MTGPQSRTKAVIESSHRRVPIRKTFDFDRITDKVDATFRSHPYFYAHSI